MNKKGSQEMPEFVGEMIGVVIVLGLIFIIFLSFSSPILDYLATYEAIKSFSRITDVMSSGCALGADTTSYVALPGVRRPFVISIVNDLFARNITYLPECPDENLCTTRISKSIIGKCRDEDYYCICLLRLTLKEDYILNDKYEILIMDKHSHGYREEDGRWLWQGYGEINSNLDIINKKLFEEEKGNIVSIEAFMCKGFSETNCLHTEEVNDDPVRYPILFGAYGEGTVLWIQTRGDGRVHRQLDFGSISFQREIHRGTFAYHSNMFGEPRKRVMNINELIADDMDMIIK